MIPETCPDHIPLKSLCYEFCPTKAQIRTYLTVLIADISKIFEFYRKSKIKNKPPLILNIWFFVLNTTFKNTKYIDCNL